LKSFARLVFIVILYCLLKISRGQLLLDPDPELINPKSLDFPKPKLFFKNIGMICSYLNIHPSPDPIQLLPDSGHKKHNRTILHKEPFKTIAKTTTDVSLVTISASIEDFKDLIPQMPKIETPG
jgi:hypothetical protein